jgi:hypothetical protein
MKDSHDFENLTIKEIFERSFGREEAKMLLEMIESAIEEGKTGDELKEYIFEKLCKMSVKKKVEIFEISSAVTRQINPPPGP